MLKRKEADGLIFLGHRLPKEAARSNPGHGRRDVHRSSTAASFSPTLGIPSVHIDNAKAAYEAMDHLYGLGHRRIGIVNRSSREPVEPRPALHGATSRAKERGRPRREVHRHAWRFFRFEFGAAAAAERLLARNRAADRHFLLQRRDGDGA